VLPSDGSFTNAIITLSGEALKAMTSSLVKSTNWASQVKQWLQWTGFNDVWLFPESVTVYNFIPIFRTRLIHCYRHLYQ
jgi:hypothetical protein